MNYERIYEFRFQNVDKLAKQKVWDVISDYIYKLMGSPAIVLDPAAGGGEFIRSIQATEAWAVDIVPQAWFAKSGKVKTLAADILTAPLKENHFEGVYISNFLEHLHSQTQISQFLARIYELVIPGGTVVVMGPNFKYCMKEYFDCSDHIIPLTHVSVSEHLFAAGFTLKTVRPRFLPFSFRSWLPSSPLLTKLYLQVPFFWPLFGRQFLIVAQKPAKI